MKTASVELAALINTDDFAQFDLYTIDSASGRLLLTSADFDIAYGGAVWSAKGARLGARPLAHWKTGLDVDQWQITVLPRRRDDLTSADFPDRIGSMPWLQAAGQGALDGAAVTIQRAYFGPRDRGIDVYQAADVYALEDVYAKDPVAAPVYPLPPGGVVPVGVLTMMKGNVAETDVNTTMAVLTINDARQILTTQMPRNIYQAACRHRLFDPGCQLSAGAYAEDRTVASPGNETIGFAPAWIPVGSGTLNLGRVQVTSGANAGFARSIASWDGGTSIRFVNPLPFPFAVGDVVRLFPGCDKTMGSCTRFGNLINYGGTPYIPVPDTTA